MSVAIQELKVTVEPSEDDVNELRSLVSEFSEHFDAMQEILQRLDGLHVRVTVGPEIVFAEKRETEVEES